MGHATKARAANQESNDQARHRHTESGHSVTESKASRPLFTGKINFAFRMLGATCGWALFIYWWNVVLESPNVSASRIEFSALEVALMILLVIGGAWLWIRHNLILARRGRRGGFSRFITPTFDRDYFGRELSLPPRAILIRASIVNLRVAGNQKMYSPGNLSLAPIRESSEMGVKGGA